MSQVTCHMSHVICPMSHVTFHLSLTPTATATDLPLLTPPLSTVDWFHIEKSLINHEQKTLLKLLLLLNQSCNFDVILELESL